MDFSSDTGFSGLPTEWQTLLKSNISKEECIANHKTVLQVLEFHENGMKPLNNNTTVPTNNNLTNNNSSADGKQEKQEKAEKADKAADEVLFRKDRKAKKKNEEYGNDAHPLFSCFTLFMHTSTRLD